MKIRTEESIRAIIEWKLGIKQCIHVVARGKTRLDPEKIGYNGDTSGA